MEKPLTPIDDAQFFAKLDETSYALNLTDYNKKLVKTFDKEINIFGKVDEYLTPIPNNVLTEERKSTSEIKNKPHTIDQLYLEPDFSTTEFQRALKLMAQALKYCDTALEELRRDNLLESDIAVIHIQSLLPELFCCRDLSESFAAIINSIQNALLNNRGQLLSEEKLLALKAIFSIVRNEPFMRFEKAIEVIMEFEEHDFTVEPLGFELLTELL